MRTFQIFMVGNSFRKRNWKMRLISLGVMAISGISLADSRDYLQFLPISPFIDPYAPSQNYLQQQAPPSPWKPAPILPTAEEIDLYKAKMEAIAKLQSKIDEKTNSKLEASKVEALTTPVISIPRLELGSPEKKQPTAPPSADVTVSPWFAPPSQQPQTSTPTENINPSSMPWIRKPMGGGSSDVYVPFSTIPNYTTPSSSSAVIYTQPDPKVGE